VPQDRDGTFEPKVVEKRQKDISGIEQKIISLYAKGMTTRQISDTIEDIYGFEVSDGMVSNITDRFLPQIEEWQNRPLDDVYPIVFIDAVHFSVRDNGQIRKLADYVILAVSLTGHKEVLSIHIGENESAKYWLEVLNELKKSWCKGHSCYLCRRTERYERSRKCGVSADRIAKLHSSSGEKHVEICER